MKVIWLLLPGSNGLNAERCVGCLAISEAARKIEITWTTRAIQGEATQRGAVVAGKYNTITLVRLRNTVMKISPSLPGIVNNVLQYGVWGTSPPLLMFYRKCKCDRVNARESLCQVYIAIGADTAYVKCSPGCVGRLDLGDHAGSGCGRDGTPKNKGGYESF